MRKLITFGLLFSLVMLASLTVPSTAETSAQVDTEFQYAAKFVCGRSTDAGIAAPGQYFTTVNVHNPSPNRTVEFRKKFARALPDEIAGKITQFFQAALRADEAMGIDCPNIYKHTGIPPGTFIEGYVVIHTPAELDVLAVYTAGQPQVATLHTERVPPRRVPVCLPPAACSDLNLSLNTGIANWQIVGDPVGSTPEPRAASVIASPVSVWAIIPGAQWIGPNTSSQSVGGNYVYEFCFCLCSGFRNPKLTLTGVSDNSGSVSLNGTTLLPALGGFTGPPALVQTNDPQLFKAGTNCLRVVVNNASFGETGFDLAGTVTATGGRCNADSQ